MFHTSASHLLSHSFTEVILLFITCVDNLCIYIDTLCLNCINYFLLTPLVPCLQTLISVSLPLCSFTLTHMTATVSWIEVTGSGDLHFQEQFDSLEQAQSWLTAVQADDPMGHPSTFFDGCTAPVIAA